MALGGRNLKQQLENAPRPESWVPPDWYVDPLGIGAARYWDGTAWGKHHRDQPGPQPMPSEPPPVREEFVGPAGPVQLDPGRSAAHTSSGSVRRGPVLGLFTRTKQPAEMSEDEIARAKLADNIGHLGSEIEAFKARLNEQAKLQKRADKDADKGVKEAANALRKAQEIPRIAKVGSVKVFEDRVETPDGRHLLDDQTAFTVESAGNMSATRRHTLTRAAVLGPFSVFTPKATKHDDRELYFVVEHPEWASVTKLNPDAGANARQAAAAANLAARQSAANKRARAERIDRARQGQRRAENAAIELRHEAQVQLAAVYGTYRQVKLACASVDLLVDRVGDSDAKLTKRARQQLDEASRLAPTAAQLAAPQAPRLSAIVAEETPALKAGPALNDIQTPAPVDRDAPSDPIAQIKSLVELRDSGALTDDEFAALKARIISG